MRETGEGGRTGGEQARGGWGEGEEGIVIPLLMLSSALATAHSANCCPVMTSAPHTEPSRRSTARTLTNQHISTLARIAGAEKGTEGEQAEHWRWQHQAAWQAGRQATCVFATNPCGVAIAADNGAKCRPAQLQGGSVRVRTRREGSGMGPTADDACRGRFCLDSTCH